MKDEVKDFLMKFGVFKVGVADPRHGFEMAKEGCHPRDFMKNVIPSLSLPFTPI